MFRYLVRQSGDDLIITEIPARAMVAVGVGATLYESWADLIEDYPDAELIDD